MTYIPNKRLIRLSNFDALFHAATEVKILNDSHLTGKKINEDRINKLFYDIDPDLGFVASCKCKEYRGNYYLGHKCPYCFTTVSHEFTEDMSHTNWIVLPDVAPPVLHPIFYLILREWLGKTKSANPKIKPKIPIINTILNPSETMPVVMKPHIKQQGFKYFYNHFDEIMNYLFTIYKPVTKTNVTTDYVRAIYEKYRNEMFVRRIPILHPSLTPMAKEGKVKAIDTAAAWAMSAISDVSTLGYEARRCLTEKKYVDKMLWKVYTNIISYIEIIITKKFGDKYAHTRRHLMGSRIHFSARSVIVPITEPHEGDEIHLPWKIVIGAYKCEILNFLIRRQNYSLVDALGKYTKSLVVYDKDIHNIVLQLKKECPFKGFSVLCGRNPTLIHGAIQLFYCTKIKTDVHDETIGISPRTCKAPNADFDKHTCRIYKSRN